MTVFHVVRHGETDWNRQQVFRGRLDVPLNDLGRRQAEAVAGRLAEAGLVAVFTSPLARARETADIIARACGLKPIVRDTFTDMDFGRWQGLTHEQVRARFPDLYRMWRETPESAAIPGAEPLGAVQERVAAAAAALAERFAEAGLCIVSHRVVSKLLMAWALGLGPGAFWCIRQDTACLNVFGYDGRESVVQTLNDTCHLRALPAQGGQADF